MERRRYSRSDVEDRDRSRVYGRHPTAAELQEFYDFVDHTAPSFIPITEAVLVEQFREADRTMDQKLLGRSLRAILRMLRRLGPVLVANGKMTTKELQAVRETDAATLADGLPSAEESAREIATKDGKSTALFVASRWISICEEQLNQPGISEVLCNDDLIPEGHTREELLSSCSLHELIPKLEEHNPFLLWRNSMVAGERGSFLLPMQLLLKWDENGIRVRRRS